MLRFFKFRMECGQTNNGSEFTNRFTSEGGRPALFEKRLDHYGIRCKLIIKLIRLIITEMKVSSVSHGFHFILAVTTDV